VGTAIFTSRPRLGVGPPYFIWGGVELEDPCFLDMARRTAFVNVSDNG